MALQTILFCDSTCTKTNYFPKSRINHFFNFFTSGERYCSVAKVHKFTSRNERDNNFTTIKYIVILLAYSFYFFVCSVFPPVFHHLTNDTKQNKLFLLSMKRTTLRNSEYFQNTLTLINSCLVLFPASNFLLYLEAYF